MCSFCGIHSIWKDKEDRVLRFMASALAEEIAGGLATWGFTKKRVEFAMHGEPTLHPEVLQLISIFRKYLPFCQLQLTTNGLIIKKRGAEFVRDLFRAGINILIVDTYVHAEEIANVCVQSRIKCQSYYEPGVLNPYHNNGFSLQQIILMDDLAGKNNVRKARKILNHAGNANQDNLRKMGLVPVAGLPLQKTCSRPFREITIHWDGTIPFCCLDWRHEFIAGKFGVDGGFADIWGGQGFIALRSMLQQKKRAFRPCTRCDYSGGFRLGLLPKSPQMSEDDARLLLHSILSENMEYSHKNAEPLGRQAVSLNGIHKFFGGRFV